MREWIIAPDRLIVYGSAAAHDPPVDYEHRYAEHEHGKTPPKGVAQQNHH